MTYTHAAPSPPGSPEGGADNGGKRGQRRQERLGGGGPARAVLAVADVLHEPCPAPRAEVEPPDLILSRSNSPTCIKPRCELLLASRPSIMQRGILLAWSTP